MTFKWWLHHSSSTIQHLDILPGDPALLAVWSRADRVDYYRLDTGVQDIPPQTDNKRPKSLEFPKTNDHAALEWQNFLQTLRAPNGTALPMVETPDVMIYSVNGGGVRVYRDAQSAVYRQEGTAETKLELPTNIKTICVSSENGRVFALDDAGMLYVDSGTPRRIGLQPRPEYLLMLAVSAKGDTVFASDGRRIIAVDAEGKTIATYESPYVIGLLACASDGRSAASADMDTGVIRVFDGRTLRQTHQSWAIDLMAGANWLQLIADLPPVTASLSALTMGVNGVLAFAMSGAVCVTTTEQMNKIPQPQS